MARIPGVRRLFRWPFRNSRQIARDVDEELSFHLDRRIEELCAEGMMPHAAREEALRQFGDLQQTKQYCHGVSLRQETNTRRRQVAEGLWLDLRHALVSLRRNPGFAVGVVAILSLTIAANITFFSLFNSAIFLGPLDYESRGLVQLWYTEEPVPSGIGVSEEVWRDAGQGLRPHDFLDITRDNTVFSEVAGLTTRWAYLGGDKGAERVRVLEATSSMFSLLGVDPAIGRPFVEDDDQRDAPAVTILGYTLWQNRFNGDPSVVGRDIMVNDRPRTVVGVMPKNFHGPPRAAGGGVIKNDGDVLIPAGPRLLNFVANRPRDQGRVAGVFARLKSGVTLEQAREDVARVAADLAILHPATNEGVQVAVSSLRQVMKWSWGRETMLPLGAGALVLLIACINIANLLLARGKTRHAEMALRASLGGSRSRLVRQLITENAVLVGLAAGTGIVLSYWGIKLLAQFMPWQGSYFISEMRFGTDEIWFGIAIATVSGVVFGLYPALITSRTDLAFAVKDHTGRRGLRRTMNILVGAEVCISVLLVIAATVLTANYTRLLNADRGYVEEQLFAVPIYLAGNRSRFRSWEQRNQFFSVLLDRVEQAPGVSSVALTNSGPLRWGRVTAEILEPGAASDVSPENAHVGRLAFAQLRWVTPAYFQTLGLEMLGGRNFAESELADAPATTAIISRSLARRLPGVTSLNGGDAIGRQLKVYRNWLTVTVVGVVEDAENVLLEVRAANDDGRVGNDVYVPGQAGEIMVRGSITSAGLAELIRAEVLALDPKVPIGAVEPMQDLVAQSLAGPNYYRGIATLFGAGALVLALVGLYSVIAYSVNVRTHEMGVRMALGAEAAGVRKMIISEALVPVSLGLAVGLASAFVLGRLALAFTEESVGFRSVLYGTSPYDPTIFIGAAVLFVLVATMASYLPARRASTVDPMIALRHE